MIAGFKRSTVCFCCVGYYTHEKTFYSITIHDKSKKFSELYINKIPKCLSACKIIRSVEIRYMFIIRSPMTDSNKSLEKIS